MLSSLIVTLCYSPVNKSDFTLCQSKWNFKNQLHSSIEEILVVMSYICHICLFICHICTFKLYTCFWIIHYMYLLTENTENWQLKFLYFNKKVNYFSKLDYFFILEYFMSKHTLEPVQDFTFIEH